MTGGGTSRETPPAGDRLLATFLDLVRIDSPSGREAELAGCCEAALAAAGFRVTRDDTGYLTGSDTGNIIATWPGTAPGTALVFSAHLDCVQPCEGVEPVVADGVVSSAGETVLGGDDKAGIAAILELVSRLAEDGRPRPDIQVVLTVAEERGLVGAKALDASALSGELCLVLDAEGRPGEIVVASPTHYTFTAVVSGRSSHAGVQPEAGISAIAIAAAAVQGMRLGRLDDETTANVGTIEGGTATNVVPAEVRMTGECRSRDRRRVEEVRAEMERAILDAAGHAGGSAMVTWTLEYEGVRFEPHDRRLALVKRACLRAGLTPSTYETGGGSDGNVFTADGVPAIVLGCGMTGVHSTSETLRVDDLHAMVDLLEAVVAEAVAAAGERG